MTKILQNHYVLAVQDMNASRAFFEALGFVVAAEPDGWIFLDKDNCRVMLGECLDALPPRDLGDHSYFAYLRVDDAAGYYAELRDKGIKVTTPIADKPWGMREFGVESPEGHRITMGQWLGDRI